MKATAYQAILLMMVLSLPVTVLAIPAGSTKLKAVHYKAKELDSVVDLKNCVTVKSAYYNYVLGATYINENLKCPDTHPVMVHWKKDFGGSITTYAGESEAIYCCAEKESWTKSHTK